MTTHKGLSVRRFADQKSWDKWLAEHGSKSEGLWLQFAKQGAGIETVTRAEAIEAALCHGWIDGQIDKWDEAFWLVRFTPRREKSKWSKINCESAMRLIEQGKMGAAGLAEVERAKADGRWEAAYPSQAKAEVPEDLQAALDANPKARAFFDKLSGVNRYAVLYRIHNVKTEKTRAAKIKTFIDMLAEGKTVHPQKS
jgi:uncharacterized protein YdeI (YjbR/CyaY-like superfamily)